MFLDLWFEELDASGAVASLLPTLGILLPA
jgi:hypothetical protein